MQPRPLLPLSLMFAYNPAAIASVGVGSQPFSPSSGGPEPLPSGETRVLLDEERTENCDPSCATCRGWGPEPIWCLSCPEGSNVTAVLEDDRYLFGFCGETCPLCYGGATPEFPGNNYTAGWPFNPIGCDGEKGTTSVMTLPEESEECGWVHAQTFRACGCPALPPIDTSEELCPLCSDGSNPQNPDAMVAFEGQNASCAALAASFGQPRLQSLGVDPEPTLKDSFRCAVDQLQLYEECGCPKPERHPDACTLCHDGAPVSEEYAGTRVVDDWQYLNTTCRELEEFVAFDVDQSDWWCTGSDNSYQHLGAEFCGCAAVPTDAPTEETEVSSLATKMGDVLGAKGVAVVAAAALGLW